MSDLPKLLDGMTRHVVTVRVTYDVWDFAPQYTGDALAETVMESIPSVLPDYDGDEAAVIRDLAVLPDADLPEAST